VRIAQRIVVLRDRRKVGELDGLDTSVDDVVAAIADEAVVRELQEGVA
jgi:simple sugar transport system ATP-binding protein